MYAGRIYADFQNLDDENRVRLSTAGSRADLQQSGLELRPGAAIPLYTDDAGDQGHPDPLLADGILEFSADEQWWVVRVDWQHIRHASDASPGESASINGTVFPHSHENHPSASG